MAILKNAALILAGGGLYAAAELLWRGRTTAGMFLLGGLCFRLLGLAGELAPGAPLAARAMLGGALVTAMELLWGLAFNRRWTVWDYRAVRHNFRGQICLPYFAAWVLLSGAGSALCDALGALA